MADAAFPMVLASKLQVPRVRPQSIVRDRVMRLLDEASDRPLTVVCAPAGYGKTTALVMWLTRSERPCAWVSLDAHDDDPRRFCAHLLAALDRLWPGAMVDAERALLGGSDLVETVVPLISAAVGEHAGDGLVVIFDDCHAVTAQASHRVVVELIDTLTGDVRVVVSTRTAPPLRLARRRVAQTAAVIGPAQLAFVGTESELLLNGSLALGLLPEQIAAIDERVDGWAAGLALVAASLPSAGVGAGEGRHAFLGAFARSRGAIAEYLVEEVLESLPARMQAFVCRTSILERLSPALCEAVLEDPEAVELLAEVRRSNLFVVELDGDWVRYHHLFAELLGRELARRSPEVVAELHLRASWWFEQAGLIEEAIGHAAAAGDGARGARLLHAHWPALLNERRYVTMQRLLAALPADRGELAGFCEALDVLCAAFDDMDQVVIYERLAALQARREEPGVAGMIDGMLVWPFYGHVGEAARIGRELLDGRRRPPTMRLRICCQLAAVSWFAGDRAGVRSLLEPRMASMVDMPTTRAWALATLALTELDDGDPEQAERYAGEALAVLESGGGQTAVESGLVYDALGAALTARGRLQEAHHALAHAAHLTGRQPGSIAVALTLILQAELWLAERDHKRARDTATRARRILDRYPDVGVLPDRLTRIETTLKSRSSTAVPGSTPTPSELRVLALLPTRLTNPQIARRLYLSNETVRSHLRRLYQRLGAHSREQAVEIARERGLL